jgi:quercetin dioxygenase-like cupin family protein
VRTPDGLVVVEPGGGEPFPGDIVVKSRAADAAGRWGVVVVSGLPGEGGWTHLHAGEPEAFFVLEGEVELLGTTSTTPLSPGSFVLVPPDTEHGLRVVGRRRASWLAIWPGALDGLPEELAAVGPDDDAGRAAVRLRHGIHPGRDRRSELSEP